MAGFKVININFGQEMSVPAGIYTFSIEIEPVGTSFAFGFKYKGESTINTEQITGLASGERQYVSKTFETTKEIEYFYPSRQVNSKIYNPVLNKGEKAIEPSPSPYDSYEYSESRIRIAKNEIDLSVSSLRDDLNDVKTDLLDTGINIADKKITVTADDFSVRSNTGVVNTVFKTGTDGKPLLKAENIDAENLIARRLMVPFVLTNSTNFANNILSGKNILFEGEGGAVDYAYYTALLPTNPELDGLSVKIYTPNGSLKRIVIKTSNGEPITLGDSGLAVSELNIGPFSRERIHLDSFLNPSTNQLMWSVSHRTSTMFNNFFSPSKVVPSFLKPGDIILSGLYRGDMVSPEDRWEFGIYNYAANVNLLGNANNPNSRMTLTGPFVFNSSGVAQDISLRNKIQVFLSPESDSVICQPILNFTSNTATLYINCFSRTNPSTQIYNVPVDFSIIATDYIVQNRYMKRTLNFTNYPS